MQIHNFLNFNISQFQQIQAQQQEEELLQFCEERERVQKAANERGAYIRTITVFENEDISITIVDRRNSNMTRRELEATFSLKVVIVTCKRSAMRCSVTGINLGQGALIFDAELANSLYSKFRQYVEEYSRDSEKFVDTHCLWETSNIADDFREAKRNLIKWLLFEHFYEMFLDAIEDAGQNEFDAIINRTFIDAPVVSASDREEIKPLVDEFFANGGLEQTCQKIIDDFTNAVQKNNYRTAPSIPILSEEEMAQVEPNLLQRKRDNMFAGGFVS